MLPSKEAAGEVLCCFADDKKESDWIFSETLQIKQPKPAIVPKEAEAESVLRGLGNKRPL